MNNGFVFGNNVSSFDYNNQLNQMLAAFDRLASLQQQTLEELREIKNELREFNQEQRERGEWKRFCGPL